MDFVTIKKLAKNYEYLTKKSYILKKATPMKDMFGFDNINDINKLEYRQKIEAFNSIKENSIKLSEEVNGIFISIALAEGSDWVGYELYVEGSNDEIPENNNVNSIMMDDFENEPNWNSNREATVRFNTKDPTDPAEKNEMQQVFEHAKQIAQTGLNAAKIGKVISSKYDNFDAW